MDNIMYNKDFGTKAAESTFSFGQAMRELIAGHRTARNDLPRETLSKADWLKRKRRNKIARMSRRRNREG